MNEYDHLKKQKEKVVERQMNKLEEDLARYKTIAELAVKGLKIELNIAIRIQNNYVINRLNTTLSEIEELSNEQT